jgi:hypothetical protein
VLPQIFPQDLPELDQQQQRDQRGQNRRQPAQKKPPEVLAKTDLLEIGLDLRPIRRQGPGFDVHLLAHARIIT